MFCCDSSVEQFCFSQKEKGCSVVKIFDPLFYFILFQKGCSVVEFIVSFWSCFIFSVVAL